MESSVPSKKQPNKLKIILKNYAKVLMSNLLTT